MPTKKPINYRALNAELDEILDKLQNGDLDIDESIKLYERGTKLIDSLQDYLKNAQNKVTKLKKTLGK